MANDALTGLGLRPLDQPFGNRSIRYYTANTAQAIYLYQPVAINNSGQVEVAALTAATQILGTVVGFLDSDKSSLPSGITSLSAASYLPASTDAKVAVTTDPNQLYIIEQNTGGALPSNSEIGNGCVLTYLATTGNTTTGIANLVLNTSSVTTTTGSTFQIVGAAENINADGTVNTTSSANCKWIVRISHHQMGPVGLAVNV